MPKRLVVQVTQLQQNLAERQLELLLLGEGVIQLLLADGFAANQDFAKLGPS